MRLLCFILLAALWLVGCGNASAAATTAASLPTVAHVAHDEVTAVVIITRDGSGDPYDSIYVTAEYRLKPAGVEFVGAADFAVHRTSSDARKASETLAVPNPILARFLSTLAVSPVSVPMFKPGPTILHGGRHEIEMRIATWSDVALQRETRFYTSSQQGGNAPWLLSVNGGKEGMVDSGLPAKAFDLLRPYLKQDVLKQMVDAAK